MSKSSVDMITIDLTQDEEFNASIVKVFADVWKSSLLSDCTILCGDQTFEAHTLVLIANSGYFRDILLASAATERQSIQVKLDVLSFQLCLEFLYHGKLHVEHGRLGILAHAAKFLRIRQLYVKCRSLQLAHTKVVASNCFELWREACDIKDETIIKKALQVALTNFSELIFSPSLVNLSFAMVKTYLCHEDIVREDDEELLIGALNWVRVNKIARVPLLSELLSLLPLKSMRPWYLKSVMRDEIVESCQKAYRLLGNAIARTTDKGQCILGVGTRIANGNSCSKADREVVQFSLTTTEAVYSPIPTSVPTHGGIACCFAGPSLFVSGVGESFTELWEFTLFDLLWHKVADMKCPRQFHCMAWCNGKVYIFGGSTVGGENVTDFVGIVEFYDPNSGCTGVLNKMGGVGCANTCCFALESDIIVAGPWDSAHKLCLKVFSTIKSSVVHHAQLPGEHVWIQGLGVARGVIILAMDGSIVTIPTNSLYKDNVDGLAVKSCFKIEHLGSVMMLDRLKETVYLVGCRQNCYATVTNIINDKKGWTEMDGHESRWLWAAACCIKQD